MNTQHRNRRATNHTGSSTRRTSSVGCPRCAPRRRWSLSTWRWWP